MFVGACSTWAGWYNNMRNKCGQVCKSLLGLDIVCWFVLMGFDFRLCSHGSMLECCT